MSHEPASGDPVDFAGGPVEGDLAAAWIHGAPPGVRSHDPPIQVHRHDEHTLVLRQSKALTYEAPFLFLLFGNDRALLLDSGDVSDPARMPLRETVDALVENWLTAHPRDGYELVVAHSHAHGDHVRGDEQFSGRPDTVVVARDPDAVREFFGVRAWPRETVTFDLGGRVLEVMGCPGHEPSSIAVFDPWSGFLLTGDTVYRGRLYVDDPPAFRDSLDALVELARSRPVRAVLGCHIEMTRTPRRDYPRGTTYQPDEPPLEMSVADLVAVRDAAPEVGDRRGAHWFDEFAIFVGPCHLPMVWQSVRRVTATATAPLRRR
jgi:hydroxyacylglutathione hydrolase